MMTLEELSASTSDWRQRTGPRHPAHWSCTREHLLLISIAMAPLTTILRRWIQGPMAHFDDDVTSKRANHTSQYSNRITMLWQKPSDNLPPYTNRIVQTGRVVQAHQFRCLLQSTNRLAEAVHAYRRGIRYDISEIYRSIKYGARDYFAKAADYVTVYMPKPMHTSGTSPLRSFSINAGSKEGKIRASNDALNVLRTMVSTAYPLVYSRG